MGASYHRTTGPNDREITISQKSLAFVASLIALLGSLFSAGIAYGVMRSELAAKVDRAAYAEDLQRIRTSIARDSSVVQGLGQDVHELSRKVDRVEDRVTDIACDLLRPRKNYCR